MLPPYIAVLIQIALVILQIALAVLRLNENISWPWPVVLIPLGALLLLPMAFVLVVIYLDDRDQKSEMDEMKKEATVSSC